MHPDEYQDMMDFEEDRTHWLMDKEEYNKDGFTEDEVQALTGIVEKPWGSYKVLRKGDGFTVKELTILPGKSLSDQRHFKRDEQWFVVKGKLTVDLESYTSSEHTGRSFLDTDHEDYSSSLFIPRETWHRPYNEGTENVVVIETWIGDSTEEDIERRNVHNN